MVNKDPLLTFEEFCNPQKDKLAEGYDRNNFHLHFVSSWSVAGYKKRASYRQCMAKRKTFRDLSKRLHARNDYQSLEYLRLLYRAYRMMHPFAESNYALFR